MSHIFYNPNPDNKMVGDCVVRAISKITDKSWRYTYLAICTFGLDMSDMPAANSVWGSYLYDCGFNVYLLPDTCPSCYTIKQFCEDYPEGKYIVCTGNHVVAVVDGDYYDAWDSGNEIPMYYWHKERS